MEFDRSTLVTRGRASGNFVRNRQRSFRWRARCSEHSALAVAQRARSPSRDSDRVGRASDPGGLPTSSCPRTALAKTERPSRRFESVSSERAVSPSRVRPRENVE